jgi:hypothetical protein
MRYRGHFVSSQGFLLVVVIRYRDIYFSRGRCGSARVGCYHRERFCDAGFVSDLWGFGHGPAIKRGVGTPHITYAFLAPFTHQQ